MLSCRKQIKGPVKKSQAALFFFFAVNYCGPTIRRTPSRYINLHRAFILAFVAIPQLS